MFQVPYQARLPGADSSPCLVYSAVSHEFPLAIHHLIAPTVAGFLAWEAVGIWGEFFGGRRLVETEEGHDSFSDLPCSQEFPALEAISEIGCRLSSAQVGQVREGGAS